MLKDQARAAQLADELEQRAERLAEIIVDLAVAAYGNTTQAAAAALGTCDALAEAAHVREGIYIAEQAAEAAAERN